MPLLDRLLIRWLCPIEAIYHREAERAPPGCTPSCWHSCVVFLGIGILAGTVIAGGVVSVLFMMLPIQVLVWRLQTTFTASGVITDEVEARTLESLRALPHPLHKIIISIYAGVLARARPLLYRYLALRAALVLLTLSVARTRKA